MKVTIAIDSFKGSMTSKEAGEAAKRGVLDVFPDAEVCVCPIADGGEGTTDAVVASTDGTLREITVSDPLMRPKKAKYAIIDNTAVIEISAAAGITMLSDSEKNPLNTSTFGVGEMIKDAIMIGIREFVIGLGGSATNDGGTGMLMALGFSMLDKNGNQIAFGAKGLADLCSVKTDKAMPELSDCKFRIACDVTNPLCGEKGCSAVFAPQKGADADMIEAMDVWLSRYADITKSVLPDTDKDAAGAGAAGGLGFAFMSYMDATLEHGIDLIIEKTRLSERIKNADIVITGEGRLDSQTVMGKTPVGVAKIAKKYGKPVLAFAGCVTEDAQICNLHGIDAFFPIVRSAVSLEEAMKKENAQKNMTAAVRQVFRTIGTIKNN